ncbi:MAG: protein kinase [Planctomycetes bacterium]|nr:protein kinase [Planctomycetota bacterium]
MNRLGPYEVGEELARGGMGVVYRARDPYLDRSLAIKVIRADDLRDPESHERFRREALVLARLRHPGVVAVHSAGVTPQGFPYLVMDLLKGGSLKARLAGGPLPPREAVRLARELAEALVYTHGCGVLHRDIKPGNVLLDDDGSAVLTDFGLAKLVGEQRLTQTGDVLGTPSFMAPEQVLGEGGLCPGTDVYALGATLYQMLTGRPPLLADSESDLFVHVLDTVPRPVSEVAGGVDEDLDEILARCLEKEPGARYLDMKALVRTLSAWEEKHKGEAALDAVRPVVSRARRRRWGRSAAFLLVGLLVGVGAGLAGAAPLERAQRGWVESDELSDELYTAIRRGEARLERDDFVGAEEDFSRVVEAEPLCDRAWLGLGRARIGRGDSRGFDDLDRASVVCPINASAWFEQGRYLHDHRDFKSAIAAIRHAVKLKPDSAVYRISLAVGLQRQGEKAQAKLAWEESCRLDPRLGQNAVFEAAFGGGSPEERVAILERGLERDPKNEEAFLTRARVHLEAGQHAEAIEAYTATFRNLVPDPAFLAERGKSHLRLDSVREGFSDLAIAIELRPENPGLRFVRGVELFQIRMYLQAIDDLEFAATRGSGKQAEVAGELLVLIREAQDRAQYVVNQDVVFQETVGPEAKPIGRLVSGDPVRVLSQDQGWAKIEVASRKGALRGYVPRARLTLVVTRPK